MSVPAAVCAIHDCECRLRKSRRRGARWCVRLTPEQRRRNKIAGLVLLAFVIAVFAWTVLRGSALLSGVAVN